MLKKSTFREIRSSIGRYIAILAIVALGVGFFSGLKVTKEAMVSTADQYLKDQNFFDYRLISTLGFEDQDIDELEKIEDVSFIEGSVTTDALFDIGKDKNIVLTVHSLTENINKVKLQHGRLPEKENEFAGDGRYFNESDIGTTITISESNSSDTLDMFKEKELTLTGIITSPCYMNFERGSSSLGNGTIAGFIYTPASNFDTDYYTEVFLKLDAPGEMYSSEYKDYIKGIEDKIESETDRIALARYDRIVSDAEKELNDAKSKLSDGEKEYSDGKKEYDTNYNKYINEKADAENRLADTWVTLNDAGHELDSKEAELIENEKALNDGQAKLNEGKAKYQKELADFNVVKPMLPPEKAAAAEAVLNQTSEALTAEQAKLDAGFAAVEQGKRDISSARADIAAGWQEYHNGKADAEEGFSSADRKLSDAKAELGDAEKELNDAKSEIADGEKDIKEIKKPDSFTLDRNTNTGYVCFESDSDIVNGISKVFPIFFFMVAALVCMTTMTRMVDEQRTQIGVLKALGYSDGAIMGKYLFYSGSAALIGCISGFLAGCYIFPAVIWQAYHIMYDFSSDIQYILNPTLAIVSLIGALLCSMGATIFSCVHEFREVPAELIRPKAPKEGKRILLERITFIWKRISFLYKVSFRNIFRYKKRFFMMVLGISGCTALLVTGFGLQDSIQNIVEYQYDEIQLYDYSINFKDPLTEEDVLAFEEENKDHIKDAIFVHQSAADLVTGDKTKSLSLIAANKSDAAHFNDFVNLHKTDGSEIPYPEKGEVVICQKLSEDYSISQGDIITLKNSDMKEMKVKVSAVCQNYVSNFAFVNTDTYHDGFGQAAEIKNAFVNTVSHEAADVYASSGKVLKDDNVVAASVSIDFRNRIENMMQSMDYIVILVIVAAGALAFIVLYNLTNINITERIREIATIKVLGFYPKETSAYVFRENFFLTAISAIVGIFLGKLLHGFVMSQISIDTIFFDIIILPKSYVFAVILTFVFAIIVNFAMYFKLEKINMTESLKSIE